MKHHLHTSIKPISCFVNRGLTNNMMDCSGDLVAEIVGISSYPDHAPTFQVLIDKSHLFHYAPPHLLSINNATKVENLKDLVYHNCPSATFSLTQNENLNKPISVYFKNSLLWFPGKILYTLDWFEGNDLLHMILLDNGRFCFMPNHKISFHLKSLPKFNKLKQEWKV